MKDIGTNESLKHPLTLSAEIVLHPISAELVRPEEVNNDSNALANIMRHLIGQRQKFATLYSAMYCRKPNVMSNVTCDWSM